MSAPAERGRLEEDILSAIADRPAAPPVVVREVGLRDPDVSPGDVRQAIWSLIGRGLVDFTAEGTLRAVRAR